MNIRQRLFPTAMATAIFLIAAIGAGCSSTTKPAGFSTPDEAAQTFVSALRTKDRAQLKQTLGSEAVAALDSGDVVADQQMRAKFLEAYDQKNVLVRSSDDQIVMLTVGANDWPLPIPIVKDRASGRWHFDAEAGVEEIVNRRIGQNELDVIEVCNAIVDAEREYAMLDLDQDGVPEYARKIISDAGKQNGLYWETAPGQPLSPLGLLIAAAVQEGYGKNPNVPGGAPRPYHGYFYRLLTSQGPNAQGGAREYEVNGRMIGGFALIAYPADYGDSGIMSFMVNHEGVVYQKDLGDDTDRIAKSMPAFDPGPDWIKVDSTAPTQSTSAGDGKG